MTRGLALLLAVLLGGCASAPRKDLNLEKLLADWNALQANEEANQYALRELEKVRSLVNQIQSLSGSGAQAEQKAHLVYLAERRMDIVRAQAATGVHQAELADLERDRDRILLAASLREADRARAEAERLRLENLARDEEARRAQAEAREAREYSEQVQREANLARQETEQALRLAESQAKEADLARQEAEVASAAADSLRRQLQNLQAQETSRGLMFTLGDVLFEYSESSLKPGSLANLDRLVTFLKRYPDRTVSIEGHTDSRGGEAFNLKLSQDRADAVRRALVERGLDAGQLQSVGLGEEFPVASNETEAGRQQNRRVEIIVLNPPQ